MDKKDFIVWKLRDLVKAAYGCTEIGIIGYPSALAYSYVKDEPIAKIQVDVSPYVYRNVCHVGVPWLGVCGVEMIAAVGAYICEPSRKLEIFTVVSKDIKAKGKKLVDEKKVKVNILENVDPVYCKITLETIKKHKVIVVIEKVHDCVTYISVNDKTVYKAENDTLMGKTNNLNEYSANDFTVKEFIDLVKTYRFEELTFLQQSFVANTNLANYGLKHIIPGSYTDIFSKVHTNPNWKARIILTVSAAIDARMAGEPMVVMSSCGSGDHGLTVSIPLWMYYQMFQTPEIVFLQSIALASLVTWKIKESIGSLSAYCGSVMAASIGAMIGLAYQEKWPTKNILNFLEDLIMANSMIICDGAKMSCTFKVANALSAEFVLFELAKKGYRIQANDGIVKGDVEKIIKTIGNISHDSSQIVNKQILEAIKNK